MDEDAAKYSSRAKYEGKTEVFRIYYNPREISFDLFLWLEHVTVLEAIAKGLTTFKAYSSPSLGPITICKN